MGGISYARIQSNNYISTEAILQILSIDYLQIKLEIHTQSFKEKLNIIL